MKHFTRVGVSRPSNQAKQQRTWRNLQRGQSLMEFALSVTVLVLVFCGAVDLGRAFYTRLMLVSAIGEGAHWSAAYPGCLTYGVAQNDTGSSNVDPKCQGTNSL